MQVIKLVFHDKLQFERHFADGFAVILLDFLIATSSLILKKSVEDLGQLYHFIRGSFTSPLKNKNQHGNKAVYHHSLF